MVDLRDKRALNSQHDHVHRTLTKLLGSLCCCYLIAKMCPSLWDPIDCSSAGSSVHGILQTRILEQVAISFSRDLPPLAITVWAKNIPWESFLQKETC